MNNVVLIGRFARDPELKFTPGNGAAVCTFTLAVDRQFKNKDGKKEADFINCVAWNKTAENIANYMSKGCLMAVKGRMQTRTYDAKDGTKRYVTEVFVEQTQFLSKSSKATPTQQSNEDYGGNMTPVNDGDIPF